MKTLDLIYMRTAPGLTQQQCCQIVVKQTLKQNRVKYPCLSGFNYATPDVCGLLSICVAADMSLDYSNWNKAMVTLENSANIAEPLRCFLLFILLSSVPRAEGRLALLKQSLSPQVIDLIHQKKKPGWKGMIANISLASRKGSISVSFETVNQWRSAFRLKPLTCLDLHGLQSDYLCDSADDVQAIEKIVCFQSVKRECIYALQKRVSEYDQLWLQVNVELKKRQLNAYLQKIQPLQSTAYSEFIGILEELLIDPVMELKTGVTALAQKAIGLFSVSSASLLPESNIKGKIKSILIEFERDSLRFIERSANHRV
jgi:hypothetical protein